MQAFPISVVDGGEAGYYAIDGARDYMLYTSVGLLAGMHRVRAWQVGVRQPRNMYLTFFCRLSFMKTSLQIPWFVYDR